MQDHTKISCIFYISSEHGENIIRRAIVFAVAHTQKNKTRIVMSKFNQEKGVANHLSVLALRTPV